MSQQLSFSALVSALTLALFTLAVHAGGIGDAPEGGTAGAAPFAWQAFAD